MEKGLRALVVVAAVVVVVGPSCDGKSANTTPVPSPTAPPTTLPPPAATLADLSAAVSSPQTDGLLSCGDDVRARVTLTNRAASGVLVTGVFKRSGTVEGRCTAAPDFTYLPTVRSAGPN